MPFKNLQNPLKPQMGTWRRRMFFAPSKSRKRDKSWNICVSKTIEHIIIKIEITNTSQEPLASSKAPNEDLKGMGVLWAFKIKRDSQNLEHGCIKDQWPYPTQDQNAKPQSGTSSFLQCPLLGLKRYRCSLHLQNQGRESKLGLWVYQRPVTISNQYQDAKIPVRILQYSLKSQIRT